MLNSNQVSLASMAVRELRIALSNFFLYTAENTMVAQSLNRFLQVLEMLFKDLPAVTLGESEGRLVVEGSALDERLTGSTNMVKDLFLTHKLHTLTFLKGLGPSEMKSLFSLLRPKALPTGVSLSQALVQQSLEHVRANEKVFVALSEGEVVVPSDGIPSGSGSAPGEQNLQEALEALQYFLQIFGRVRPDHNKQEVARRLMENMGVWLKPEQTSIGVSGEGGAGGSGGDAGPNVQPWRELMGSFLGLKGALASLKTPAQLKETQLSMDELLKKLVLLGESQGVELKEESPANEGSEAASTGDSAPTGQGSLFETDPVLSSFEQGQWEIFFEPSMEQKVNEKISFLQDPGRAEDFEKLWEAIWGKISSTDEATQALALRRLNRLQWNQVPRPLQLEGLRQLRVLLSEMKRPANFPIALTLVQDWLPLELALPDWSELLEMTRLLMKLADLNPPRFDKQNLASRVALDTIFCEPILDSLLSRYQAKDRQGENTRQLFLELGRRVPPFLFQKMESEATGSPLWRKTVEMLELFEKSGARVYESWLDWREKESEVGKFLDIFTVASPPADLQDYFERHWNSFNPASQSKILSIARQWKRKSFRPFLLRLLERPEAPIAQEALEALAELGMEGDGETIIQSVKKYPPHGTGRDNYWIKACQTLGQLGDAPGAAALMEWAEKYKFMEHKKERSLEVRRSAIQALGRLRSKTGREFLAKLAKDVEKELKPDVEKAIAAKPEEN